MKHAHHSDEIKDNLVKRLNRIEGQIRGLAKMINNDVYCDDIINQITSVQAALNGVSRLLLEAHIKSCFVKQVNEGNLGVVDEIITTIGKMLKR